MGVYNWEILCKYCCKKYEYGFCTLFIDEPSEEDKFYEKYKENETNHHCIIPIKNKYMNINVL